MKSEKIQVNIEIFMNMHTSMFTCYFLVSIAAKFPPRQLYMFDIKLLLLKRTRAKTSPPSHPRRQTVRLEAASRRVQRSVVFMGDPSLDWRSRRRLRIEWVVEASDLTPRPTRLRRLCVLDPIHPTAVKADRVRARGQIRASGPGGRADATACGRPDRCPRPRFESPSGRRGGPPEDGSDSSAGSVPVRSPRHRGTGSRHPSGS